jgi:pSer/pThr/pTyr-binding forkhead associated (FHA) protein
MGFCGRFRFVVLGIAALAASILASSAGAVSAPSAAALERVPALVQPSVTYLSIRWSAVIHDNAPPASDLNNGSPVTLAGGSCSGFFVSPDGYVATASHCTEYRLAKDRMLEAAFNWAVDRGYFDGLTSAQAVDYAIKHFSLREPQPTVTVVWSYAADGSNVRGLPARQVGNRALEKGDVALLKIDAQNTIPLPIFKGDVNVGAPVVAVGFPGIVDDAVDADKVNPSFNDGNISSKKTIHNGLWPIYEVSAPMTHGMSGGPTVNTEGQVLGFVDRGATGTTETFGFISPASFVSEIMQDKGVSQTQSVDADLLRKGINAVFDRKRDDALKALNDVVQSQPDWQIAQTYRAQALQLPKENKGLAPWLIALIAVGAALLLAAILAFLWRRGNLPIGRRRASTAPAGGAGRTGSTRGGDGAADPPAVFVVSGSQAGERFPVRGAMSIGREGSDITLDDNEVSRRHAVLRPVANGLEIQDAGSANGTYVNGERVEGGRRLAHGDSIRLGKASLEVWLPAGQPPADEGAVTLVVKGGGNDGKRYPIDRERSIGRETADIIINDEEMSRRHAVVRPVTGGLEISDLQSSNGTFVNGNRINGGHRLSGGDRIRLGTTTLEVEMPVRSSATVVRGGTVVRPHE